MGFRFSLIDLESRPEIGDYVGGNPSQVPRPSCELGNLSRKILKDNVVTLWWACNLNWKTMWKKFFYVLLHFDQPPVVPHSFHHLPEYKTRLRLDKVLVDQEGSNYTKVIQMVIC